MGHIIYLVVISATGVLLLDFLYTGVIIRGAREAEADLEAAYRIRSEHFAYGLKPHYSGNGSWGGGPYHVAVNGIGFRDAVPRSITKKSDKPRVVFIGDSFTEGIGLDWHDTFVGKIAAARPDLDIMNAAVASYSPSVYYRKIAWLISAGYTVDLVWVLVDISDIQDEALRSTADDPDARVRRIDSARPKTADAESEAQESPVVLLKRFLRDNFFLTFSGLKACRVATARAYALLGGDPANLRQPPWWVGLPRAEWTLKVDEDAFAPLGFQGALTSAVNWMDKLHGVLEKHGIPLVVTVYPWPNQIFHNDLESRQVDIWREWCKAKCNRFVNLFPRVFEAAREAGPFWIDELFLEHDMHFSQAGNAIMANAILGHVDELFPTGGPESRGALTAPAVD